MDRLGAFAAPLKRRIEKHLKIEVGDRVLDVGCGAGLDTLSLARSVGGAGLVIGLDYDGELVARARDRAAETVWSTRVGYVQADAGSIPFAGDAFDACRCERLFQHVPDGTRILSEMVRVTQKGGRIVVADTDWGTLSIDAPHVAVERRVVGSLAGIFLDGYAGRKLFGQMKDQGLQEIAIDVWPIVWTDFHEFRATSLAVDDIDRKILDRRLVSANELDLFWKSLEQAQQRGAFFAAGSVIIVSGSKPAAG